MSVELVQEQISLFLSRSKAEVLCIRGRWGVGKTHTWVDRLQRAQKSQQVTFPRYSYVSLFGVNSLDAMKLAIFENVILVKDGIRKANLETLDQYVSSLGSWRKLTRLAASVPVVRNLVGADTTALVSFMTVRDQIVCIDDFERRGSGLPARDVLGLVSYLREQRNCKVVLILNHEELDAQDKDYFQKNLEKVVDVSLEYEPTPPTSAEIAVQGSDVLSEYVRDRSIALGITNIRVIQRIFRFASAVQPLLARYHPDLLRGAVSSIALFSWSHDQPDNGPSLEFLKKMSQYWVASRVQEVPPEEVAWRALLDAYGYVGTDSLDLVLIDGIEDGYFDPRRVHEVAPDIDAGIVKAKAQGSFETAWRKYHDSFDDNQECVLDGIYRTFKESVRYISPNDLNGTVQLFKDLGRTKQAAELITYYLENRDEDREFFDLEGSVFGGFVTDPDIRSAFRSRAAETKETRDIAAIILDIRDGWNEEQLSALATTSVEEYRRVFKTHSGRELRRLLANVFRFDSIVNRTEEMNHITTRARAALQQIGSESAINARRVSRFGIKTDP